jgi:SAM-dependent methyltransferase
MKMYRLFLIPGFRERVAKYRFFFLSRFNGISSHDNIKLVNHASYSGTWFRQYASNRERIEFLVGHLSNTIRVDKESKLLVLGPRYETEIFGYIGLGFKKQNISALDTYSYSRSITTGNLHEMPFDSDEFDTVIAGFTLAYSHDLPKALTEIGRVLKKNGVLIFSFELEDDATELAKLRIPNYEGSLVELTNSSFRVMNWFVGQTSWAARKICGLSLSKL